MFCGGGGLRGGGRGGHRGGGRGHMFEDALPQPPRLLFYEAIALLLGDQTRRSIPNVIGFIHSFHTFFTTHE